MDIRAMKHTAKLSEWSERIRACRTSGQPVRSWCAENGVNIKSYYRWEQLYLAEATVRTPLPAAPETGAGALVRIEPEKLPVAKGILPEMERDVQCECRGIILRQGGVELDLPEGMAISRIAELVKALSVV